MLQSKRVTQTRCVYVSCSLPPFPPPLIPPAIEYVDDARFGALRGPSALSLPTCVLWGGGGGRALSLPAVRLLAGSGTGSGQTQEPVSSGSDPRNLPIHPSIPRPGPDPPKMFPMMTGSVQSAWRLF